MVRAILLCGFLLLVSSGASAAARPSLSRSVNARRLLHAGHSDESANENAADATSYLSSLQAQGLTLPDSINQALNVDPATGLNEDAVSTLMQDVQGYVQLTYNSM